MTTPQQLLDRLETYPRLDISARRAIEADVAATYTLWMSAFDPDRGFTDCPPDEAIARLMVRRTASTLFINRTHDTLWAIAGAHALRHLSSPGRTLTAAESDLISWLTTFYIHPPV